MGKYEEGMKLFEECCGSWKDVSLVLSTIAVEPRPDGKPYPFVRDVNACYEDGTFYVTTSAKSNKIRQIRQNPAVAFVIPFEEISGNGIGENLGWVLDPKNAELRTKLREAFADWYDQANNEQDENCVILAIHITDGRIFRDHGAVRYNLDFMNKAETGDGKK